MAELILSGTDFKTLSSDTRLQIIKLLSSRNYNLTELSAKLKLSAPSIKQHLDVLLASDLILIVDSSHKWKYYSLSRKGRKLVEPYSTQVLIVLSTSLVGILGIALIASAFLGIQSFSAVSDGTVSESAKIFSNVPSVAEAGRETVSASVEQQLIPPAIPQAISGYQLLLLALGVLFLVFAFLIYKRKIRLFR